VGWAPCAGNTSRRRLRAVAEENKISLKIQYGQVYIQLPTDDLEALEMAEKAIQFMKSYITMEAEGRG